MNASSTADISSGAALTLGSEDDYKMLAEEHTEDKGLEAAVLSSGNNEKNNIDDDDDDKSSCPDVNDEGIQRDAANDIVACVVHMALIFFSLLVVAAVVLCSVIVAKFGLIAFALLGLLVFLFIALVAFVNKVLRDDAKLKPVRRQLQRWQALAKAVVLQEVRNFQLDWHEHLLLTDGKSVVMEEEEDEQDDEDIHATLQKTARGKRGKSIVFRFVVKPFLSIRGRRQRKKQEAKAVANEAQTASTYEAPTAESSK